MRYTIPDKDFVSRIEAADILGVTSKCLRDWERAGRGPPMLRISFKTAVYPTDGLRVFLEAARRGGRAAA